MFFSMFLLKVFPATFRIHDLSSLLLLYIGFYLFYQRQEHDDRLLIHLELTG